MLRIKKADRISKKISQLIPDALVSIPMRLAIFLVFWQSVQTKIDGWTLFGTHLKFWGVTDSALMLFEYEYDLPLIPYDIAAYLATLGEFFLALGVLLGLFTRLSALGLLIMTAVIQIFVYPEIWKEHLLWAGILLYLLKYGAGNISVDRFIKQ